MQPDNRSHTYNPWTPEKRTGPFVTTFNFKGAADAVREDPRLLDQLERVQPEFYCRLVRHLGSFRISDSLIGVLRKQEKIGKLIANDLGIIEDGVITHSIYLKSLLMQTRRYNYFDLQILDELCTGITFDSSVKARNGNRYTKGSVVSMDAILISVILYRPDLIDSPVFITLKQLAFLGFKRVHKENSFIVSLLPASSAAHTNIGDSVSPLGTNHFSPSDLAIHSRLSDRLTQLIISGKIDVNDKPALEKASARLRRELSSRLTDQDIGFIETFTGSGPSALASREGYKAPSIPVVADEPSL